MKLILVGSRRGRAVIHWRNVFVASIVFGGIGLLLACVSSYYTSGEWLPTTPAIVSSISLPILCAVVVQVVRTRSRPLDQLPALDKEK